MSIFVTIAGGASLVLVAFATLLHIEQRRGDRVLLVAVRSKLDDIVVRMGARIEHLSHYVGTGAFRVYAHHLIHFCLRILLAGAHRSRALIERLLHRNAQVAVETAPKHRVSSYLRDVADHKKETQLSPDEREDLKQRSLNGD